MTDAPARAPRSAAPRLLDLFCGAGGAAMGYARAGFEVVGVDIVDQPRYPFEFHQYDALEFMDEERWMDFDAVHASPPCQAYSIMRNLPWLKDREYWDSIPPTRERLQRLPIPWVLENVMGAPLDGIFLCGTMFGLRDPTDGKPIYRHRLFEASFFMLSPGHPKHYETVVPGPYLKTRQNRMSGLGGTPWKSTGLDRSMVGKGGHMGDKQRWGRAVGIDWMTGKELGQAIPPVYTEFIGTVLLQVILGGAA